MKYWQRESGLLERELHTDMVKNLRVNNNTLEESTQVMLQVIIFNKKIDGVLMVQLHQAQRELGKQKNI